MRIGEFFRRFFNAFRETPPQENIDPSTPAQLHLFAGDFGSEVEATNYVYNTPDSNHPEPFTNDLPGAYIDTNFVEIAFGERKDRALYAITKGTLVLDNDDTLIIVSEKAFGGFPYSLNDTPRVRYLGHWPG